MTIDSEASQYYPEEYVLGLYHILQHLGSGAFGEGYRARHTVSGEDVALKIIRVPETGRWEPRFAEFMCQPRHPNIVSVQYADRIDDCFVIALDFFEATAPPRHYRTSGPWAPCCSRCFSEQRRFIGNRWKYTGLPSRSEIWKSLRTS